MRTLVDEVTAPSSSTPRWLRQRFISGQINLKLR
jgi:hypothetical protein